MVDVDRTQKHFWRLRLAVESGRTLLIAQTAVRADFAAETRWELRKH